MATALERLADEQIFQDVALDRDRYHVEREHAKVANAVQVGGRHYKGLAIEPWDYIEANQIGFLEGNAIKYLTRWRDKGGVDDLRKARHYVDKLIEIQVSKGAV